MAKKKQNISFEEATQELEKVINMLEGGDLSLEDSLTEFSKGIELYKHCYDMLNKVDGKVKIILGNDSEEIDFDAST